MVLFAVVSLVLAVAGQAAAEKQDWRELLVPSFEAEHKDGWHQPGADSFVPVVERLHKVQEDHNITEVWARSLSLGRLPRVTNLYVNMSDGVGIWTRVVNPWPYNARKGACLVRSPYGTMATQNIALLYLVLNDQVAVMQEGRGTWRSGGKFDLWRQAGEDGKTTIDWIVSQPWSNGEVYSVGGSADGIDALEETLARPKQLHGEWLIWTSGNGHRFIYPGGAYRKDLLVNYLGGLADHTRGASTALVLPETEKHDAYDPWWYNVTGCEDYKNSSVPPGCRYSYVKWPLVLNAGWFDIFQTTMIEAWLGVRAVSQLPYRDEHVLIVGPLGHNVGGNLDTGYLDQLVLKAAAIEAVATGAELTAEFWRWTHCSGDQAPSNVCQCQGRVRFGANHTWSAPQDVRGSIACDARHFPDPTPGVAKECQCQQTTGELRQRIGRVNLFVMSGFGSTLFLGPGNYWTSLEDFPRMLQTPVYLAGSKHLSSRPAAAAGTAEYTYDPHDPTPMEGGDNLPGAGTIKYSGSADQASREERSDVLVFDGEPLAANLPVVGLVSATLFVSSSAPDTDFFVTVEELYGAKSMLVRYGMLNMQWRQSASTKSAPMSPSEVYEINVNLGYIAYIFGQGSRIRVSISSAANPYYVASSNTGSNDMAGPPTSPKVANNTVHFSAARPSRVLLPVVAMEDIPKNPHFTPIGPFKAAHMAEILV